MRMRALAAQPAALAMRAEVLAVDRTLAAEVEVMAGDYFESFAGNASAAGYVFEEGHHVGGLIRAAEADRENCVRQG